VGWSDVSSNYSGLFFRVLGGGSATFGETQEENTNRLAAVRRVDYQIEKIEKIDIPLGWSGYIKSDANSPSGAMNFYISRGEVRPRNQAVRIWERNK
jgi:hypothetical protein